jgi:uncharacterized protein YbjQ (UPF0145 family)
MLVVTTETVPGFRVDSVIGHVLGVTARGLNPFNEGVKLLEGGINPRMAASLEKWRQEAVTNMIEQATRRGANAVLGMRFDHRHISPAWVEICAYGTAVQLHPQGHEALNGAGAPAVAA